MCILRIIAMSLIVSNENCLASQVSDCETDLTITQFEYNRDHTRVVSVMTINHLPQSVLSVARKLESVSRTPSVSVVLLPYQEVTYRENRYVFCVRLENFLFLLVLNVKDDSHCFIRAYHAGDEISKFQVCYRKKNDIRRYADM